MGGQSVESPELRRHLGTWVDAGGYEWLCSDALEEFFVAHDMDNKSNMVITAHKRPSKNRVHVETGGSRYRAWVEKKSFLVWGFFGAWLRELNEDGFFYFQLEVIDD